MLLSNVFSSRFSLFLWTDNQKRKGKRKGFGRFLDVAIQRMGLFGIVYDWNDYELGSRLIWGGKGFWRMDGRVMNV